MRPIVKLQGDQVEIQRDAGNPVALMSPGEAEIFAYQVIDAVNEIREARAHHRKPEQYWTHRG